MASNQNKFEPAISHLSTSVFGRFRPVCFPARNRTGGYRADRARIGLPNGDQGWIAERRLSISNRRIAEGLLCQYPSSMGWIIEIAVDWIWTGVIVAAYRRYGLIAAAVVLLGPLVLLALLVALLLTAG